MKNKNFDNYTPTLYRTDSGFFYAEMLIELEICPICGKPMILKRHGFPLYYKINQDAQMKNAEIQYISKSKYNNKYICCECAESGKSKFTCYICKTDKPSDKLHSSFGDPADHLCTDCYETVSAKRWNEIEDNLIEEHRYDFE